MCVCVCVCVYVIQYLSADIIKERHETLPGCEDGVAGSKDALIIIHCIKLSPLKQTVAKQIILEEPLVKQLTHLLK